MSLTQLISSVANFTVQSVISLPIPLSLPLAGRACGGSTYTVALAVRSRQAQSSNAATFHIS